MSDAQPVERIPLQFVYMCRHSLAGYFRRRDGSPLNVSTMRGPFDRYVACEPFDPADNSSVRPRILPLLRICRHCRRLRIEQLDAFRRAIPPAPYMADWLQITLELMHRRNHLHDIALMEAALGDDILGVRNRMARRVIERPAPAENNDNPSSDNHNNEDDHGMQF